MENLKFDEEIRRATSNPRPWERVMHEGSISEPTTSSRIARRADIIAFESHEILL